MSYCRWSSDDFRCDLYCYASAEGYTTHVAASRVIGDPPHIDWSILRTDAYEVFGQQYKAQMDWMDKAEHAPIGLPYDGESFYDPDLPSFLATITMLRQAGYNVPDFVFDSIKEEIQETK